MARRRRRRYGRRRYARTKVVVVGGGRKYRRGRRRRRSRSLVSKVTGGKKFMGLGTGGILGLGLLGAGAAALYGNEIQSMIPVQFPGKKLLTQLVVGGPAGVVGGYLVDQGIIPNPLKGFSGGSSTMI